MAAPFVDHYETLQLSPSADGETVERVYRLLAKRYHPDSPTSGNVDRFNEVREAYEVLSNPDARAAYDARYDQERSEQWRIYGQETAGDDRQRDQRLFHSLLSLLYIARRRDPDNAGLAPSHMERVLGTPREHLDFPLWYLRKRGFVEVLENGLLAITVDGVDKLGSGDLALPADRLLPESSVAGDPARDPDEDDLAGAIGAEGLRAMP
jgi:hypothetical protein